MNFHRSIFFVGLCLCCSAVAVRAAGRAGGEFLSIDSGARAAAMGGAFAAVSNETCGMLYNPAGLAYISLPEIQMMYAPWLAETNYGFVGFTNPFPRGAFAMGLQYFTSAAVPRIVNDEPKGNFTFLDRALNFSYAHRVGAKASAGFTLRAISSNIDTDSRSAYTGDAGIMYRLYGDKVAIGLSGQNLLGRMDKDPLPQTFRLGAALRNITRRNNNDDTFTVEMGRTQGEPLYCAAGFEHWDSSLFALRLGYHYIADEQQRASLDLLAPWRAGFGLHVGSLIVDYAYQPFASLGSVHSISLRWRLSNGWPKRKKSASDKKKEKEKPAALPDNIYDSPLPLPLPEIMPPQVDIPEEPFNPFPAIFEAPVHKGTSGDIAQPATLPMDYAIQSLPLQEGIADPSVFGLPAAKESKTVPAPQPLPLLTKTDAPAPAGTAEDMTTKTTIDSTKGPSVARGSGSQTAGPTPPENSEPEITAPETDHSIRGVKKKTVNQLRKPAAIKDVTDLRGRSLKRSEDGIDAMAASSKNPPSGAQEAGMPTRAHPSLAEPLSPESSEPEIGVPETERRSRGVRNKTQNQLRKPAAKKDMPDPLRKPSKIPHEDSSIAAASGTGAAQDIALPAAEIAVPKTGGSRPGLNIKTEKQLLKPAAIKAAPAPRIGAVKPTAGKYTSGTVSLVYAKVLFSSGASFLDAAAIAKLNQLFGTLVIYPFNTIEIKGHTDDPVEVAAEHDFSDQRAKAVYNYLISKGIAPDRMKVMSEREKRESQEIPSQEKAYNRWVDVSVMGQ